MVEVKFHFNEDHACFDQDLWYEIDRMCNIMKQNIYKTIKDKNSNSVAIDLCSEASGSILESNGNTCGMWNVKKITAESC